MQYIRPVNHWLCLTALLLIWVIPMTALPPPATAETNVISFQEGVNGYTKTVDTYIKQAEPAGGHGTLESVEWDTDDPSDTSQYKYALIRFDDIFGSETGRIPVGAVIQSATLTYTVWGNGNQANVNEATVGWSEDVTWNDFGGDAGVQVDEYGNLVAPASGNSTGNSSIDVTASLSAWAVDPSANRGWIFIPTGTDGVDIRSSEYATVGERPKLVVNYDDAITLPPNPPVLNGPADDATGVSTSPVLDVTVSDPDGDAMTVTFYGRAISGGAGEDFTIIAMPDTQKYACGAPCSSDPLIFTKQTQWIVDSRETMNIAYVAHLGDCVENGDAIEAEWITADEAFSLIENPVTTMLTDGIPYGISVGNHDQTPKDDPDGTTIFYNQYFGESRFLGRAYYGGNDDDGFNGHGNDNHFELFSAGGMDFIVIHLEYDTTPDTDVLDWADARLKEYDTRRAIIVSHYILGTGNPGSFGTQGQAIYTALKDNPNLFLMLCGHVPGEGRRQDIFDGNTVNTLLADYQSRSNGGDGWLRIMKFSPSANQIEVKTYSPTRNSGAGEFETDDSSQFTLSYNMSAAFEVLGSNTPVASGSDTTMGWPGLKPFTGYEWYVTVDDGIRMITGPVWSFTTIGIVGDLDDDCDADGADLALLISDYGCATGCTYDLTGDEMVDGADLAEFAMHYGEVCP